MISDRASSTRLFAVAILLSWFRRFRPSIFFIVSHPPAFLEQLVSPGVLLVIRVVVDSVKVVSTIESPRCEKDVLGQGNGFH